MKTQTKPSRVIGPEDVRRGDYVTVTHATYEFLPDGCTNTSDKEVSPVRVTAMHHEAGRPYKVVSVCLPFVLVQDACNKLDTMDLRRHRIARVSRKYGKQTFKAMKALSKNDRHWAY